MSVLKICHKHGLVPSGGCLQCKTADNQRRWNKSKAHGLNTPRWKRLRERVLIREGHRCQVCGNPATTVHIPPEYKGNHRAVRDEECLALCHPCHGTIDAPRSSTGGVGGGRGDGVTTTPRQSFVEKTAALAAENEIGSPVA